MFEKKCIAKNGFCFGALCTFLTCALADFCIASETEKHTSFPYSPQISWQTLNTEDLVYLPNPDFPSTTVPLTSSFAYTKAQELLKSIDSLKTRMGMHYMVELYNNSYGPVVQLFDMICDEREKPLKKSLETLETLLKNHFSGKAPKRLGGWEEEDE